MKKESDKETIIIDCFLTSYDNRTLAVAKKCNVSFSVADRVINKYLNKKSLEVQKLKKNETSK